MRRKFTTKTICRRIFTTDTCNGISRRHLLRVMNNTFIIYAGIGRVALDVRLGCLGDTLSPNSEPQKIIDAAKFALRNVAALELKAPYWRYIPTPLWSRYVRNMNYFIEWVHRERKINSMILNSHEEICRINVSFLGYA